MPTSSGDQGKLLGELVPQGGGDPIPLRKEHLLVGRRENCDIVLRFGNVSSNHCELTLESGYWFVKDLGSRNGTRLNGYRITKKRMDPGDTLSIAKRDYKAVYSPTDLGAEGPPPDVDVMVEIMSHSLLEGAGLSRKKRQQSEGRVGLNRPRPADQAAPSSTAAPHTDEDEPGAPSEEAEAQTPRSPAASPSQPAAPPPSSSVLDESGSDASPGNDAADGEGPDEYQLAPE